MVVGASQSLITGVKQHPSGFIAYPLFSELFVTLSLLCNCVTLRVMSLATERDRRAEVSRIRSCTHAEVLSVVDGAMPQLHPFMHTCKPSDSAVVNRLAPSSRSLSPKTLREFGWSLRSANVSTNSCRCASVWTGLIDLPSLQLFLKVLST